MRRALTFAVKAIISAGLLYLAVDWTHIGHFGDRLSRIKFDWLALMVLVQTTQTVMGAIRWRQVVLLCGRSLSTQRAIVLSFIAAFFNQTLPSSVGGDAVRTWMLARQGAGWSIATYSVITDRLFALLALSVIVIVCLPWTLVLISDPLGRTALILIGFGSFGVAFAFILLGWVQPRFLKSWLLTRHVVEAAAVAARVWRSAQVSIIGLSLSLSTHLLTAFAAWCGAQAVAAPFDFVDSIFLVLPVMLVAVVPISIAGWGVREGAMTIAFAYAGLSQPDGLLISLLFGSGLFVVGALGGLIWIVSAAKKSALRVGR